MQNLINLEAIRLLEEVEGRAVVRRLFHARNDPFELSNKDFIRLYRVNKRIAKNVSNIVSEYINEQPRRLSALDINTQVVTALRFMASGSYLTDIGYNINSAVSQPSVSRCIKNVTKALNQPEVLNRWVKCPSTLEEVKRIRDGFWEKYQFPGIIGCIDCTHVAIVAPPTHHPQFPEYIYVNRKGYHSINVQLICDSDMKIIHVNAKYPGSTHDSYIWNNCNFLPILKQLHNRRHTFYLLGDSGYALRPWLLTPVINAEPNSSENHYNIAHRRIRSLIERTNGLLKMHFRCLLKHRVLHYKPDVASRIINSCVVLHNMCIKENVPLLCPEDYDFDFGLDINDNGIILN
ncbi:putative nuclease HARBI1 [Temnothorax nylanderi]|uniref:putative nuclease HARBI1 n=1 Tax=Temnothorax nylanderi TaxID=102681 RepID=UPI003A8B0C73